MQTTTPPPASPSPDAPKAASAPNNASSRKILVFKAHTTGLPANQSARVEDGANWPRLVSLSWRLYSSREELLNSATCIVQPQGFEIPVEAINIHGITTERAATEGLPASEVGSFFLEFSWLSLSTFVFRFSIASWPI